VTDAPQTDDGIFVRRALIVIALAAGAFLLWEVRTVLALLFGAVLVATIFRAIGDILHEKLRLPMRIAVMISVLLIAGVIALIAWLIGS
jgi:predicted PurR-regulated permease PerM